jgi:hypothetical protein
MENASAAFLEAVRRSMRSIRNVLGAAVIDPALLTHAERLQHEGYLRREEAYGLIRALARTGTPIKEIVRRTGRSRKLVREICQPTSETGPFPTLKTGPPGLGLVAPRSARGGLSR